MGLGQGGGMVIKRDWRHPVGVLVLAALLVLAGLGGRDAWYGYLNRHAVDYYVESMRIMNGRQDANLPEHSVIFYGDSLMQGLAVQSVTERAVNFGIGHATTAAVAGEVAVHQGIKHAAAVVFSVGINDILAGHADEVLRGYRTILAGVPIDLPVIIVLVLPVDEQALSRPGLSASIARVNQALVVLCQERPSTRCISMHDLLVSNTGQLEVRYHIGDGLHLNKAGNDRWIQVLRDALKREGRSE